MAKELTEAELNLREFKFELKAFDKEVKAMEGVRKAILKDIERAEKAVAKEKAAKGSK